MCREIDIRIIALPYGYNIVPLSDIGKSFMREQFDVDEMLVIHSELSEWLHMFDETTLEIDHG